MANINWNFQKSNQNDIKHFGVLGMKWGVRKEPGKDKQISTKTKNMSSKVIEGKKIAAAALAIIGSGAAIALTDKSLNVIYGKQSIFKVATQAILGASVMDAIYKGVYTKKE